MEQLDGPAEAADRRHSQGVCCEGRTRRELAWARQQRLPQQLGRQRALQSLRGRGPGLGSTAQAEAEAAIGLTDVHSALGPALLPYPALGAVHALEGKFADLMKANNVNLMKAINVNGPDAV